MHPFSWSANVLLILNLAVAFHFLNLWIGKNLLLRQKDSNYLCNFSLLFITPKFPKLHFPPQNHYLKFSHHFVWLSILFIFISFKKKKCSRVLRWTVSQTPQNSDVIPEAAVIIITHTTAETHCIIVFNGVLTSFCIPELMMFTFFIHMNFYCANGSVWPLFLCFWQICAELEVMGRCFRCIVMFKLRVKAFC